MLGKEIVMRAPSSWLERGDLPLWVPMVAHRTPNLAGYVQVRQKLLRELGVESLKICLTLMGI